MALEDLLLDLSSKDPHFALHTFWYIQAHLTDLAADPNSFAFQNARRLSNTLQYILFNVGSPPSNKFRENAPPSLILSSMVAASVGLPQLGEFIGPIAKSQGKRQKSFVFELARTFKNKITDTLTMNNTRANSRITSGSSIQYDTISKTSHIDDYKKEAPVPEHRNFDFEMIDAYADNVIRKDRRHKLTKEVLRQHAFYEAGSDLSTASSPTFGNTFDKDGNSVSMPELQRSNTTTPSSPVGSVGSSPTSAKFKRGRGSSRASNHGANVRNISPSLMTTTSKIKLLKSNYFRCETQFAIALQTISVRLSAVPQEARLSSLRAELSLLNRDLPAEVDIPTLLPPNRKGKLHKVVHIAANEAAVLNSAERVPFLLLIEFLSDELDFDPGTESNNKLLHEKPNNSYIFDLGIQPASTEVSPPPTSYYDKPMETDLGDLSVVKLTNRTENEVFSNEVLVANSSNVPIINNDDERTPDLNFSADYQLGTGEQGDSSDLATQMRIAAVMLSQLDNGSYTLPADQTAAIKARIITSMQSLQDHFGYKDLEAIHGAAGERKLENDMKTGGVSNINSSAYLGEDWNTKKERIRRRSLYGHLENWDLCSVIAKTGDDLRQEAFATQMIQAMASIWRSSNVPVWVKRMRILITSANTGLVETITDAISIHSIKKALTKISIESGENPKGTITSLTEHFERSFGEPTSSKYKRAQDNFAQSLAAYSVICYLLQIKDRHNGNIMLDNDGHIVHIDFGFLLSNSPGSVGFEAAPFKLPLEYVEILGGLEGAPFLKFKDLTKQAFKVMRKHADHLVNMVELMQKDSNLPCFKAGPQTSVQFRQRFQLHLSETECDAFVENYLIAKSIGSIYTRLYDQFQLLTQGIYS